MFHRCLWPTVVSLLALFHAPCCAEDPAGLDAGTLRLVPFPRTVEFRDGRLDLTALVAVTVPKADSAAVAGPLIAEMRRAGLKAPSILPIENEGHAFSLVPIPVSRREAAPAAAHLALRPDATPEDYRLIVRPDGIECLASGRAGLFYGMQTLCQLIRANRSGTTVPCLAIEDGPALRWRCFQDDLTRGPSSTLATLRQHVDLGAALKMNLLTYYMEYQFAFKKHPIIGPENGSLTPEDLAALVAYAKPRQIDILGNQQSFGHFTHILRHEKYAPLRETPYLLTPVKEETYELLDDLYSEVCPLLPLGMFNVCCDETYGLGRGPAKTLAAEIGPGGVYVRHVRRVHDILRDKYDKRMMMWGDIILQHPDKLDQIPKDTVMLTWGYGAQESFENQIVPFARSGYEFFVCPGISNWSRIPPDFGCTTTNVRNFVRDGVKHGAIGMLNTAWEDDGEALQGYKWHGYAWGAECAWTGSKTSPEDFNRRLGAVLFGEKEDHFGRAIELLSQSHRLPGMQGMNNRRFWQFDFLPTGDVDATGAAAQRLLDIAEPAREHLQRCQAEAVANAELLDHFLFCADRVGLIGRRMAAGIETARLYDRAYRAASKDANRREAAELIARAEAAVRATGKAHRQLGDEFRRLWLAESKPYALDWTMARYDATVGRYDALADKLADANARLAAGEPLPSPAALGLALPKTHARPAEPARVESAALLPDVEWLDADASHRWGLSVAAGPLDRFDLPVEVEWTLPDGLRGKFVRAFLIRKDVRPREIPAQLSPGDDADSSRFFCVVPGALPKGSSAAIHVYLGVEQRPEPLPGAVSTGDAPGGMKWIENDKVRLLLAPEGAHVYRWEIKPLDGRDLTMPGDSGWAGFSDMALGNRNTRATLRSTAAGPALVRFVCADGTGLVKTVGLSAGVSWIDVLLSRPTPRYWDFDNPANFAADGPTPGEFLFSDGTTGPVGKQADALAAQVPRENTYWGVKFNGQRLALGLATPEVAARHFVCPGAGAGGVGIEGSTPANHFVTFAGTLDAEPSDVMDRLCKTLDLRHVPSVTVFALQARP